MTGVHVEYLGFKANGTGREYTLRVRQGANDPRDVTLVISNEAFLAHRVRYQDAPDICFLKLQRELASCADGFRESLMTVSDADLEEYRTAHAPKAPRRRSFTPPGV
jgi:hypothetical protein